MEENKMKMKKNNIIIICLGIITMLILAGCQLVVPDKQSSGSGTYDEVSFDIKEKVETKQFSNEDELTDFLESKASNNYGGYYDRGFGGVMMEEAMMDNVAVKSAAEPATGGQDYSETNIQVEGVDEADILKTDGKYIYTISNNILHIVDAYPGEDAELLSSTEFDMNAEGLFIKGDKLAIFGNDYGRSEIYLKGISLPYNSMSFLNIYDVSDPEEPKLEKEYKYEGNYFRGRMIGDYMYIVTTVYSNNRVHPMPFLIEDGVTKNIAIEDMYYYDINYRSPMLANIHAIDITDSEKEINSVSLVVEGSQNMYMSNDNIYITYSEYVDEYDLQKQIVMEILDEALDEDNKELIEKIKKTDNDILSQIEKEQKIWQIYQNYMSGIDKEAQKDLEEKAGDLLEQKLKEYKYFEFTNIHKISVDKSRITPEANGKVPGHVINQFSMDEYDNVFRIATTVNARWSRTDSTRDESQNQVHTLNKDLEILDSIEGIAEGERIYSTRFMKGRLYMVTFRQVDPFFVIDLSDPENIVKLGELKIPGFSRYLHPYDDNTIIGIGQDANENGRTTGLKISLFDVSDVTNPKEVASYVGDDKYANSEALYEHKAFLFSKDKELMVIPVTNYGYDGSESYTGAFVFKVQKDDIELRGLIDHSEGSGDRYYWNNMVERSLYIEDLLYTKSPNLLRINRIDDLSKVKNVKLEKKHGIPVY